MANQQTGGSTTPNSAPGRGSRRTSFNLPSRRSTNQRIDEILETARERAETMSPPDAVSPHGTTGGSAPRQRPWNGYEDSSADENTGLVGSGLRRSQRRSEAGGGTAPRRKSIYDRNSREGSSSQLGDGAGQQRQPQEPAATNGNDTHEPPAQKSWGEKVFSRFQSVELENKGSVARDHLALERTFLAWLRTSLAFASIGIAVTQLFRLNTSLEGSEPNNDGKIHTLRHVGKPLGATFLGISILTLILGYRRYVQGQEWVIKGKFPASRGTVMLLVLMSLAIMVLSLVVVIVISPSEDEDL